MSTFATMVEGLVAMGVPRHKAEREARQQTSDAPPAPGSVTADPNVLETEEQREIMRLLRAFNFVVRCTSQYRPSKVAKGLPDLIVMHPARGIALFWESKRQVGGEQSAAQKVFEEDCRACGWTYRSGDRFAAARYLINLGLAEPGDGPCGIVPVRHEWDNATMAKGTVP